MQGIDEEMQKTFAKALADVKKDRECEDIPEIMELRRQRDEYTRLSQECQKKIDEAILETHNTPDIEGKYVKINEGDSLVYGRVSKVNRLFKGIRIDFDIELRYDFFKAGLSYSLQTDGMCYDLTIDWKYLDKIEIIDKDMFLQELKHDTDLIIEKANRDETADYV